MRSLKLDGFYTYAVKDGVRVSCGSEQRLLCQIWYHIGKSEIQ